MDQSPQSGESRAFDTPQVVPLPEHAPTAAAIPTTAAVASKELVLEEIVNPWQTGRSSNRSMTSGLIDPWRDARAIQDDSELIDPWRGSRVANLDTPVAAFDWDTSPPELLNPWPTTVAPLGYDLDELIDPWATR
jgi:hypothetical protein